MIDPALLDRLDKIAALAARGVGGEKENAERALYRLLRKHGLTMRDLENRGDAPRVWLRLRHRTAREKALAGQVLRAIVGDLADMEGRAPKVRPKWLEVLLPAPVAATVRVAYDVYRRAWIEAEEESFLAFLLRHRLYGPGVDGDDTDETELQVHGIDRERSRRIATMAAVMPDVQRHARITAGGGQWVTRRASSGPMRRGT